mmetsp:Transcript_49311/g.115831  ORF Transcript_49311/g.115831 Transcript_49311/m.115831 type:complete len:230 (-) Transcript_49311:7-696(-)
MLELPQKKSSTSQRNVIRAAVASSNVSVWQGSKFPWRRSRMSLVTLLPVGNAVASFQGSCTRSKFRLRRVEQLNCNLLDSRSVLVIHAASSWHLLHQDPERFRVVVNALRKGEPIPPGGLGGVGGRVVNAAPRTRNTMAGGPMGGGRGATSPELEQALQAQSTVLSDIRAVLVAIEGHMAAQRGVAPQHAQLPQMLNMHGGAGPQVSGMHVQQPATQAMQGMPSGMSQF